MSLRVPALGTLLFAFATAMPLAGGLACGGGTPQPKDESDTAASNGKSGSDDSKAATSASADSTPPASPPAGDSSPAATPPAAASAPATGDIKPTGGDDPWLASHQMPPKEVMNTVRPVKGKVQACFKAGVKRDPSTTGEVKIRFVITNAGVVRVWRDDGSSMTDGDVTQCVGDVVNKLKFPKQKSPGDAWGSYSINFGN